MRKVIDLLLSKWFFLYWTLYTYGHSRLGLIKDFFVVTLYSIANYSNWLNCRQTSCKLYFLKIIINITFITSCLVLRSIFVSDRLIISYVYTRGSATVLYFLTIHSIRTLGTYCTRLATDLQIYKQTDLELLQS